jgi:hypothetical protein
VAYVSMHGPLGLRAVEPSLRVVNVDGGGARVIVPTLLGLHPYIQTTAWGQIEWSPQGDRIALLYRDSLTVAALDGSSVITRSLAKQSAGMCRLVGWTPDGKELLLLPPAGIRPEFQHLLAYHPESDRTRELFVAPHGVAFGGDRIAADMTTLMVRGDSSEAASGLTLVGVHVDDGTVETLVEHACSGGFDVSADAKTVVYGACEAPDGAQRGQFEIRVLDRMSGAERATPPIDGRLWEVHLSPNAQWVAVLRYGTGPHPLPVVAAGLDGSVTEFEGPWTPLGWTGRSGLVLAEQGEAGYRRIAIGDATSGEVRVVFP